MFKELSDPRCLSILAITARLILAIIFGGLIGIERGRKGRAAGFRTYMLVTMGAALGIIVAEYLFIRATTVWSDILNISETKIDVTRITAASISGVGFLASGTIIKNKHNKVQGLTTAAGLWACTAAGIACGSGFYSLIIISLIIILFIIRYLPGFEEKVSGHSRYLDILIKMENKETVNKAISLLKNLGSKIREIDTQGDTATISVEFPNRIKHYDVITKISAIDGILGVQEV